MTPRPLSVLIVPAAILAYFLSSTVFYTLPEWEQAVITQFGRPVGKPVTEAGLHAKMPFIQRVRRLDKRILNWDGYPNQIPTKDKKYISVDTTARWRITDPLLFIQTVQTESGARARLDGILDAVTRDTISSHNLVEAVRNSNAILDKVNARLAAEKRGEVMPDEEVVGEIEPVALGRESLSGIIIEKARVGLKEFGIELIDVQLRHIAYEASVEAKVYDRMISERQRIAQKIRSEGQGEKSKIQGKINKDLQEIDSSAYRTAQEIRGKAEAQATRVYARSMNADPEFYEFVRTLDAYRKSLPADSTLILSTDSEFLKKLRKK